MKNCQICDIELIKNKNKMKLIFPDKTKLRLCNDCGDKIIEMTKDKDQISVRDNR